MSDPVTAGVAAWCNAVRPRDESEPVARLVTLDAPTGESELGFWRRKAAERALCITALQAELVALAARLGELLEAEA